MKTYVIEFERKQWQKIKVTAENRTEAARAAVKEVERKTESWDTYEFDPYIVGVKEAA